MNDPAYGGSLDDGECDLSMSFLLGLDDDQISCGIALAWLYGFPPVKLDPAMVFHSSYHTPQARSTLHRWPV